jgi:hypothetical protein
MTADVATTHFLYNKGPRMRPIRSLSQWLLHRPHASTAIVLFALSCGTVGILGSIADTITVRSAGAGVSEEATKLLEVVSLVLNVYLMPLVLLTSLLAASNIWFAVQACKRAPTVV